MSPRDWRERIQDILEAIAEIRSFTQGMDFDAFEADPKTLRAVELNFIIIGEAANQVPEDIQEANSTVPWMFMRAMRNRLVHVYFNVDPRLVWDTIQTDLPTLVDSLTTLQQQ
jgi:uncharacterized protein with HEPN domain